MKRLLVVLGVSVFVGAGCVPAIPPESAVDNGREEVAALSEPAAEAELVLPIDPGASGGVPVYKRFGEYFDDRFHGYHVGDDIEIPPEDGDAEPVEVRAALGGTVEYVSWVSGYGGVIILQHERDGEKFQTLYGHVSASSTMLRTGDTVEKGQVIALLGEDKSHDTDGERQHLHFAVYPGTEVRLQGYVNDVASLSAWTNPHDFFAEAGVNDFPIGDGGWISSYDLYYPEPPRRDIPLTRSSWGELVFAVPVGWDVEYIPSIDALNLYEVSGTGSARERSQVLIRSFEASDFETLATVNVLSTEPTTVGADGYEARRYVIEKQAGAADFADQPLWRNAKHAVTDFRAADGFTRYYVVAANPELDVETYRRILDGVQVLE